MPDRYEWGFIKVYIVAERAQSLDERQTLQSLNKMNELYWDVDYPEYPPLHPLSPQLDSQAETYKVLVKIPARGSHLETCQFLGGEETASNITPV
jgi:hypothetical protein